MTEELIREENEEQDQSESNQEDEEVCVLEEPSNREAELEAQFQRLSADFANYKRRIEKERESIRYMALEKFVLSLLPTMDNFERAMEHSQEKDAFYEGISLIYTELLKQFEANKIVQLNPLGEIFDPNFHQAVSMDSSGEYEKGLVSQVLAKGYLLNDKVIRPATVRVAE